jgi:hypothetical protein
MAKMPKTNMDRPAQRLVNEVYETAARHKDPFTISVTHSQYRGHYLGMSQIGKRCDRAIWYGFRGAPRKATDGRMLQLFNVGDYVEKMQIFWLEQAGYKITDRQADYSDLGGFFRGHPDGVIHGVTDLPHAWDAKSTNKKKFDALKTFGMIKTYPVYCCQAQMMMHYSGTERAIYTFTCKDNSEWYAERLYYSKFDAQIIIDRAARIIEANEPPEKPFDIDDFNCQWCSHRPICWFGEDTIVNEQICGTCHYCLFPAGTLKPWCANPAHSAEIKTWGIGCPDWIDRFEKSQPQAGRLPIEKLGQNFKRSA